jgi:type IV secretion system protein VirB6
MFTWLGTQLTDVLNTYVFGVVSTLMTYLLPLALTATTIWILLFGWAVLRGEAPDTVPSFAWRMFKIVMVLSVALQTNLYMTTIADTADGLATGVAATFLTNSAPGDTVSSPYTLLDQFNDDASKQTADIMMDAGITRMDLLFAGIVFSFGSVVYLCVTVFVVTLVKVFMSFVIAVGPLFVLALAWKPTQRFFDSWMSMVLNAVVLTWFAFFALGLSAYLGHQIFVAIEAGGGFQGPNLNVLAEATRYCVLMVVMAVIVFQAPGLAASLTGGAAMQQGVQMIQNALMVAGLRSRGGKAGAGADGAGGVIRAGAGLPYTAGRAAGAAMSAAQQGAGHVRKAAYQLAALRGRR